MTRCERCETFSALYDMNRRCCQVRLIGLMPPQRRNEAIQRIADKRGQDAADKAEALALAELNRWRAYRAKLAEST